MIGLFIKDLYCMKEQVKSLIFILLVWGVVFLPQKGGELTFLSMCMVASSMFVFSLATYDRQANWETYALGLPVTRESLVREKYGMALIFLGGSALLSTLLIFVFRLFFPGGEEAGFIPEAAAALTVSAGICLLYNSIALPLCMWLGSEKARYVSTALFALVFFIGVVMLKTGGLSALLSERPAPLITGFLLLSAAAFILSYFVSAGIYRKKDF